MTRRHSAVHRTIMLVDVEGFGDRHRTNSHQVAIREGVYRALQRAFDGAGITWADCDREDRGDGVLILAPPVIPKARFVEQVPRALFAALQEHNTTHPPEERIRLRMALHAGEVTYDSHGVTAAAVNLAFRLLDATPLKVALAESPGTLAVITSGWFFEEVVRHCDDPAPATFRPVRVTVKETSTVAWISLPDHPYPPRDYLTAALPDNSVAPVRQRGDRCGGGWVVQVSTAHPAVFAPQAGGTLPVVPRQLPPTVRTFVGRAHELAMLDGFLKPGHGDASGPAIVAVDGTAGVGKTCLAVWWAHRAQHYFSDGTLFVDLKGHGPGAPADPCVVLASFLQALGVPRESVPDDPGAQTGLYRSLLAGRRVLVVLDNAADVEQVRPLLPASAGCLALVTSRTALIGVVVAEGAHRIVLDLFTASEAAELVREAVGPDRAAAEQAAVAELVRLCARLPLALRVATGHVADHRHVSVAEMVEDISGDDDPLSALSRTGDERTAVRTVFDWSFDRLSAELARLFGLLGLHPGLEFGPPAIAALTGTDTTTAQRHLEALVDAHLAEPVGRRRYRMHDLLHAYAADRVAKDVVGGRRRDALTAMLNWYAHTATVADRLVFPTHPSLTLALPPVTEPALVTDRAGAWGWLTEEYPTLLAALRHTAAHGPHQLTIALAAAMRFLALRPRALWRDRLEAESHGLAAARAAGDHIAEAVFLRRRADTHQMLGHWAQSDADLDSCIAMALQQERDPVLHGEALCGLGRNRKLQLRHAEAIACYEQALPLVRGTCAPYVEAVVEANLSQLNARLGRNRDALCHAERELELHRDAGDTVGEGYALHDLATAWQALGNHETAAALGDHAVAIFRSAAGTEHYLATALETTANSLVRYGDVTRAAAYLDEATTILQELGDPHAEAMQRRADDISLSIMGDRVGSSPGGHRLDTEGVVLADPRHDIPTG